MDWITWLNLIKEITIGGIAGYMTNDVAIKMLFKKYGPFGGVIIKTKNEFIENVSELVERDIINHTTLKKEIEGDEFKKNLSAIISDILKKYIYKNTDDLTIGDILNIDNTFKNVIEFYDENSKKYIEAIFEIFIEKVNTSDIITNNQLSFVSEKIFNMASEVLNDKKFIDSLFDKYSEDIKNIKLADFIKKEIFVKIEDNIIGCLPKIQVDLKEQFDNELNKSILFIFDKMEINNAFIKAEESIKNKTLNELFGENITGEFSRELSVNIINFINSDEGKRIIRDFSSKMIETLENNTLKITELLNEELNGNLKEVIKDNLPEIMNEIIIWLRSNKISMEALIEHSVDDVLSDEANNLFNLQGKIKKVLKDNFYKNVADNSIESLISYIDSNLQIDDLSTETSNKIVKMLHEKTVGEVISLLKKNNVINEEIISDYILFMANEYLNKSGNKIFESFCSIKLRDIIVVDVYKNHKEKIEKLFIEVIKDNLFYSEKILNILKDNLYNIFDKIYDKKFEDIFSPEIQDKGFEFAQNKIFEYIEINKYRIKESIFDSAKVFIQNKSLSEIINQDIKKYIISSLSGIVRSILINGFETGKKIKIEKLIDKINSIENIDENLSNITINFTNSNLEVFLKGNVKSAVKKNLSGLPDRDIQKMVEDFMGKELKPITWFGAILGGAFGLPSLLLKSFIPPTTKYLSVLISVGICALVGYLTNVIAIWMIFKPYYEKKFLGMRVPFTPGVISKQKPRFAASLGSFIDDELLKAETLDAMFKEKKEIISADFKYYFSKDDYELLDKLLERNSGMLSEYIYDKIKNYILTNRIEIADGLSELLDNKEISEIDLDAVKKFLFSKIKEVINESEEKISEIVYKMINSDISVKKAIGIETTTKLNLFLKIFIEQSYEKITEWLSDDEKIQKFMNENIDILNRAALNDFNSILNPKIKEKINNRITGYIFKILKSERVIDEFYTLLNNRFLVEFSEDKKISEMYNGEIIKLLNKNSRVLSETIISIAKRELGENIPLIKQTALKLAREKIQGYSMINMFLNLDKTITAVVEDLTMKKLPWFMDMKEEELRNIFIKFINEKLGNIKASEIKAGLDKEGITGILLNMVENPQIYENISDISGQLLDSLMKINIGKYLEIISVKNIGDLITSFDEEAGQMKDIIINGMKNNNEIIKTNIIILVSSFVDSTLNNIKIRDITGSFEKEKLSLFIKENLELLLKSEKFEKIYNELIKKIHEKLQNKKISEFVNKEEINLSVIKIQKSIFEDESLVLKQIIKDITENLSMKLNKILDNDTKDFTINIIADAIIEALESNFYNIVDSINIKNVTEGEVNEMEPQEIEILFNSFAGHYLKKLEIYGFWGGILGLISILGL